MSTILIPGGPDVQINTDNGGGNGVAGAQQFPQISVLSDGRFAVVYQSPSFGNAADNDIIAAFVNPDGSLSGSSVCVHCRRSADHAGGRGAIRWRIWRRLHRTNGTRTGRSIRTEPTSPTAR